MLSIKEWRAKNEATSDPITTPAQQAEPDDRDWEFYRTKIQGRAKQYLGWFIDEVSKKQLNLVRKGFILQEVMDALGMSTSEVVRVVSNIKRALAKKQALQAKQQQAMTAEKPAPATPPPQEAPQPMAATPATPDPSLRT